MLSPYIEHQKDFFSYHHSDEYEKTALYTIKVNTDSNDDDYAIIWNNVDLTESRAIYVFKTRYNEVNRQLEKLIEHINDNHLLRSKLRSAPGNNHELSFMENLGYVGNVKKRKGYKDSYNDVIYRLEELMQRGSTHIPILE